MRLTVEAAVAGALVVIVLAFFFAPIVPVTSLTPAGARSARISPSFGLFQCGAFVGGVVIEVPNGSMVGQAPSWVASPNWNCQFPHAVR
ncbi:MAG: hypothetical protein JRM80_05065 [Nitrososphaerota archaeon]|nr:hypothetical protein [Nitrososphaerota archaeon]